MMRKHWLMGSAFLAACSGSPDAIDVAASDRGQLDWTEEARQDAWDAKFEGALSEAEYEGALAALAANGVARQDVEFRGRIAVVEGDMLIDVDEVLGGDGTVDKGYTANFTNVLASGFNGCAPYQCGPFAPTLYSRFQGSQYQFRRPDTEHTYYLVVNFRGNVSSQRRATTLSWIGTAASRIVNASATDCLSAANVLFLTLTKAEYDALSNPLGTQHHVTTVEVYTANSGFGHKCAAQGDIACANLPGDRGIRNDSKVLSPGKHRFGDRIHMNLDTVETIEQNWVNAGRPETGGAVGVILHELMHTLGYGHTGGESGYIRIPGSSNESIPNNNNGSVPANRKGSVMRPAPSSMDRWGCLSGESGLQCLPLEDEIILTKLYNGSCAYSSSFRNVN